MKKVITVVSILVASMLAIPSSAAETKSLVVIDSYFDNRVSGYECATIQGTACVNTITSFPTSINNNINHGNAMLEVAKRQNPSITLIGLRAASTNSSASDVNAGTFIEALKWVKNNSNKVSAVSISRFFNGVTACTPASTNTSSYGGVVGADLQIRSLIAELKASGIPVFAATGNVRGKAVDYPACILDTNSVSVGGLNKTGTLVSLYQYDANTDYFVTTAVLSYRSTVFGLIANTTSAATAATAAKYVSGNSLTKFVSVNS